MSGPITVIAGVNGAGKSSVAGAFLHASGDYFVNPDEVAAQIRAADSTLDRARANALAWQMNLSRLRAAIDMQSPYAFETTLGGRTITTELLRAVAVGIDVKIWYIGLDSVVRHLARIQRRVLAGGHPIPAGKVHERFETSRKNLIRLLPHLAELALFDNSHDAVGTSKPMLRKLAHYRRGEPLVIGDLTATPGWAKPIVAALLRVADAIQ